MHHDVRPTCIFGCEGQKDNLKHYLECPSLWNPICPNLSLPWIESPLARLAFLSPTRDNFVAVAVAFNVYHALRALPLPVNPASVRETVKAAKLRLA